MSKLDIYSFHAGRSKKGVVRLVLERIFAENAEQAYLLDVFAIS
jgi:hypothetical protein